MNHTHEPCQPCPDSRGATTTGGFTRSCSGICPALSLSGSCLTSLTAVAVDTTACCRHERAFVPGLTSVIHVLAKTAVPWACSRSQTLPDTTLWTRLGGRRPKRDSRRRRYRPSRPGRRDRTSPSPSARGCVCLSHHAPSVSPTLTSWAQDSLKGEEGRWTSWAYIVPCLELTCLLCWYP